jgi:FixJ family two-component response regulator
MASGGELLERVDKECPALLVTEIELGGVGGFELRSALEARGFHIPVIGMTSRLDPGKSRKARLLGFLDLVEKPFVYESVLRAVREVLKVEIPRETGDTGMIR